MVLIRKDESKTVAFYLQDGVEVLDFAGPMEVLVYAGYKVFTVSADKAPIRSQGILKITPDYTLKNAPKADILAFFGGNSSAAFENAAVVDWVRRQTDVDYYFSVCTGAFVLAEAGLLDGKTATTFHDALNGLEENYPEIDVKREVRYVDNGSIITTAGVSAGIDGALHLVAKLQGLNAAKRTAYYMEYDHWKPGDGLILSDDNPYTNKETFRPDDFVGKYEYRDGQIIHVKPDGGELVVSVGRNTYPIYHESGDLFSDVRSEPIHFQRDVAEEIIGYKLSPKGDLFKKLYD
jgi:putative intracellular protease/amidase